MVECGFATVEIVENYAEQVEHCSQCKQFGGRLMSEFRIEKDSMGEVQVPAKAYYGAQTQRAVENFPVSGWPLHSGLIRAM